MHCFGMTETTEPIPRRGFPWLKAAVAFLVFILLLGGLWWWFTRPIQPVQLTAREKAVVKEKIAAIQEAEPPKSTGSADSPEPAYERGKKEIILTEREINGLLNANTDLGRTVSFQLGTDAVLARIETPLDPDLPIVGGKTFKARARFIVSEASGQPSFVIDDLTVWGISLPNEWLGGLKGRNLLAEILGGGGTGKVPGIESFAIRPGQLTIKLTD